MGGGNAPRENGIINLAGGKSSSAVDLTDKISFLLHQGLKSMVLMERGLLQRKKIASTTVPLPDVIPVQI
ncbi:hypothetical protein L2E82_49487 [Cichorium intybus]|uniref:Uncharacterized protein n=1 Tax=Cichorium intybus TaxID=13427 RepID=A0ACB8Z0Y5_CICIN|nr:hypothetical protein L2E82_49487 [Cichorium intybus]